MRSFAPSSCSNPQPPFARFLIILGQTAVGRCRWPSAGLHIASVTGTAAVKWPAPLTSCSFFSITLPTGFVTWYWRDMELKGKKKVSRRPCLHAIKLKIGCNNYNVVSNYSTGSGFVMFSNNETISKLLLMLIKHLLVSRFDYWRRLKWSHLKLFIYPPPRFCFVLPFNSIAPTSSP